MTFLSLSRFRVALQKGAGRTGHGARSERRSPMSAQRRGRAYPGTAPSPPPRRRARWGALLLALAVIGGGAWWLSFHQRSAEMAAERAALDPEERALREAVAKATADPEPSRD